MEFAIQCVYNFLSKFSNFKLIKKAEEDKANGLINVLHYLGTRSAELKLGLKSRTASMVDLSSFFKTLIIV